MGRPSTARLRTRPPILVLTFPSEPLQYRSWRLDSWDEPGLTRLWSLFLLGFEATRDVSCVKRCFRSSFLFLEPGSNFMRQQQFASAVVEVVRHEPRGSRRRISPQLATVTWAGWKGNVQCNWNRSGFRAD